MCPTTYPYGGTVYAAVLEAVLRGLSSNLSEGTKDTEGEVWYVQKFNKEFSL